MSIRIDGTNTTANPGITGGDADTGLQFGTDEVSIVTGGTERLFINSSGNVGVGTTSPAVACDVTGEVRASTGILFGSDTAAANTLDDYEEGTWTPTAFAYSGTLTVVSANYVKIGNVVHIQMYISFSNTTDGSDVTINGLPFTAGGGAGNEYSLLTAQTESGLNDFDMRTRGTTSTLIAVYNNGSTGDAKPDYTSLAGKFIIMGGTYYAV